MDDVPVIDRISDEYVAASCRLDPTSALLRGQLVDHPEFTDFSPEGCAARIALDRDTLAVARAAPVASHREGLARSLLVDRLEASLAQAEHGEHLRPVRVLRSSLGMVRQVFDLVAKESPEDWEAIAERLERVPAAVAGCLAALEEGRARGVVAARRQAVEVAEQCATWAGGRATPSYFSTLVGPGPAAWAPRLAAAAGAAEAAFAEAASWLRSEYAPAAEARDAVGPERYVAAAAAHLGATLDAAETYAWGWEEVHRVEAEMAVVAGRILPGATVAEAIENLERDPALAIEGVEDFRQWLQDLMDRTIEELDGVHFTIAPRMRRVVAMIAPPGSAAAMYYTGPNEDFSQPGRTWYPTLGRTRFPLWGEVSICYHEGVPGHHLQVAQVRHRSDVLNRFQRSTFVAGHGEGWALYAERLMDELGYLERPEYRLGLLRAQVMRAVRVVVDIGMHLELRIRATDPFHPGARWTPELGQAFVTQRACFPADFMASEIVRYLGMPAQAISYKVGERVWLAGRDAALARARAEGRAFDLRAWHGAALDLGPLGLDTLADELARC